MYSFQDLADLAFFKIVSVLLSKLNIAFTKQINFSHLSKSILKTRGNEIQKHGTWWKGTKVLKYS